MTMLKSASTYLFSARVVQRAGGAARGGAARGGFLLLHARLGVARAVALDMSTFAPGRARVRCCGRSTEVRFRAHQCLRVKLRTDGYAEAACADAEGDWVAFMLLAACAVAATPNQLRASKLMECR